MFDVTAVLGIAYGRDDAYTRGLSVHSYIVAMKDYSSSIMISIVHIYVHEYGIINNTDAASPRPVRRRESKPLDVRCCCKL